MSNQLQRILSTKQASEFLGLATSTLEKDRITGRLGIPFLKLGRRVAYDLRDLEAWIDRHRRTSTSEVA